MPCPGCGIPVPPVVGLELQAESGEIVADAELAWAAARLVVLRPDQAQSAAAFETRGWRVVLLAEGWQHAVAKLLKEG